MIQVGRRPRAAGADIGVRAALQQQLHDPRPAFQRGVHQRCPASLIELVHAAVGVERRANRVDPFLLVSYRMTLVNRLDYGWGLPTEKSRPYFADGIPEG